MSTAFVTGASGFIGQHLALTLAEAGTVVHVLTRSSSNTDPLQHPNIHIFQGDLLDRDSIRRAMTGCFQVFHLAGLAKMWMKDKEDYFRVNVTGTDHVIRVAAELKAEKIVATSTAGVFPPSNGRISNESSAKRPELYTTYERTKNQGEELALDYARQGLPVVVINPTKVYGPGPIDDSNSATLMLRDYLLGKWKFIPGNGGGTMNYVYIEDAVEGILSAMELAAPGSQYIIGGENASYDRFFGLIQSLSGVDRRLYHIPYPLIRSLAWLEDQKTKLFGVRPFITSEWVRKLPFDWSKDISRANHDLGYRPRSLEDGLRQTIDWLRASGQAPPLIT